MTLLSRILGLMREMLFAQVFGPAAGLDAFIVALRVPGFMRRLFAEGAFTQAFVPVLSEYHARHTPSEEDAFINGMATVLSVGLAVLVVLGMLGAVVLVLLLAPGFWGDPQRLQLSSHMLRIMMPYLLFVSLAAFVAAILNTYRNFWVPALSPIFFNVALLCAGLWVAPGSTYPIVVLAWAVLCSGVLQLGFQLPFVAALRALPRFTCQWRHTGVMRVVKLMSGSILGISVYQLMLLLDTLFASFLPVGSISWLYFSNRLTALPIGVFSVAIATVILPHLSRRYATQSPQAFAATLHWALRCIVLIAMPAMVGLMVLAPGIIATLFHYGKFAAGDVYRTSQSLVAFAFGLPALMCVRVLAVSYYARQNIRTPVRVALWVLAINILLNFVLIVPLQHAGLALATSLGAYANVLGLLYGLVRQRVLHRMPGDGRFLRGVCVATLLMGIGLWWQVDVLEVWLAWGWQERVLHLLGLILPAILLYFAVLWGCGVRLSAVMRP